jgi:hypothetical protein
MIRSTYVRLVWIANEFTQVCLNADFGLVKLQITVNSFYANKNAEFQRRAQNEIANRHQTPKNFHCKFLEGLFVQTLLKKKGLKNSKKISQG